jgi:hypothetical protein
MKASLVKEGDDYIRISRTHARRGGHQIKVEPDGSLTLIGYHAYLLYNFLRTGLAGDSTAILRELESTSDARTAVIRVLDAMARLAGTDPRYPPSLPYRVRLINRRKEADEQVKDS